MATGNLAIKTYKQEGNLAHEYHPLRNMINEDNEVVDFNTNELDVDLNNPLNIECQPSYDGTVNLIINDDKNPPRIINTRFSKIEDNRYKIINRNQLEQTNLYRVGKIDQQTRLFRNINKIPRIDLINVYNMGQLKGGNYTFYVKFADNDYNKTDVVCESGQVSVFKGYLNRVESISGTLLDELTDKSVTLRITNVDTSFSKFYLYFTRETSDTNGIRITKAGMFTKPYDITSSVETITLNGYEEIEELSPEEINIQYNLVTAAKTQAQVQNMLFFGNVQGEIVNIKDLQNISYYIKVQLKQDDTIGWVSPKDYTSKESDDVSQTEYYSPNNIYYKLGYWPDELYRLGVVYIMNDDSLSPVFNLRGCRFKAVNDYNYTIGSLYNDSSRTQMNYLERDVFISDGNYLDNTFGVFKNPDVAVLDYSNTKAKPLFYQMTLNEDILYALTQLKVKGFFFVRQKRIPTSLCQGVSVGIDRTSYVPMLYDNGIQKYFTESFLSPSRTLVHSFDSHKVTTNRKECSGLLSLDANVISDLQSNFDGTEFVLKAHSSDSGTLHKDQRHFWITQSDTLNTDNYVHASSVFVDSEVPLKYVNGFGFATKCGTQEDVSQFSFFDEKNYKEDNQKLLRGIYCPFIGTNAQLKDNEIYTIKIPNYSNSIFKDYFSIRGKDTAPFFAVSNRYSLTDSAIKSGINSVVDVYRGDCYTNTVTIRLNRNFIDSEVPINDIIVDPETWKNNYKGYMKMINDTDTKDDDKKGNFASINRADVNTVSLGMWVTYKCLSNYNLGLRSEDRTRIDEYALMGSPRSFYPLSDMTVVVSHKIEESRLLNGGYSTTVGQKRNFVAENVPYVKKLFDNRVMFSNVQQDDDFKNAYRIFQGLSYKDIDRQYGAIVKFIPWGVNILCIFEHGIGIIPINEKALIQTSTDQSIHMYGAGVLQNQISLISADFGSIWPESIVRTPIGVYGVDTSAKKIWRYSDGKGLEIISDMKIQRYLNDHIKLDETDKYPIISLRNVKTHYNNYKGDVMFTFYNAGKDETWNMCFNERMDKWITRYSWTPLYSENINNIFYSLDRERAKVLGYIYDNRYCTYGLHTTENQYIITSEDSKMSSVLSMSGYTLPDSITYKIDSIETSYLNSNNEEVNVTISNESVINTLFHIVPDDVIPLMGNMTSGNYVDFVKYFSSDRYADITHVPVWYKLNMSIVLHIGDTITTLTDVMGVVCENEMLKNGTSEQKLLWEKIERAFLRNGFYVHGRAGIFNEIDYEDESFDNQILPTKWYEKQEPFEFEFVVNAETGLHKVFDNLVIISNNVKPNELEYEIEGDVFEFNKAGIFRNLKWATELEPEKYLWDEKYNKPKKTTKPDGTVIKYQATQDFVNCEIEWDTVLNSYTLKVNQKCKDLQDFGRRLGNIQYKEDSWYLTIDPIIFREKFKINDTVETNFGDSKAARIRDKYCKIRVKYTGEDMVIITALKTLYTQSYA